MERCGQCSTSVRCGVPRLAQSCTLRHRSRFPQARLKEPRRNNVVAWSSSSRGAATKSIADDDTELFILSNGTVDYYAVLQVDDDASEAEIKAAYRQLAKVCHPDVHDAGHEICILLNEAYDVLMNPVARMAYDAQLEVALQDQADGYTGKILSKWIPDIWPHKAKNEDPLESRAVFVDELSCIGCKMCVWCASATFRIDPTHGRSRAFAQWLDTEEKLQMSIDSCPVDCIHWVDKSELPALEYVTQYKSDRVNVAAMMSNSGRSNDIFAMTKLFLKERRKLEEERIKASRQASPMQEEARRRAAEEMARQWAGSDWFSSIRDRIVETMASNVNGNPAGTNSGSGREGRVGRRKRTARRGAVVPGSTAPGKGGAGTIPLERSLVPAARAEEP